MKPFKQSQHLGDRPEKTRKLDIPDIGAAQACGQIVRGHDIVEDIFQQIMIRIHGEILLECAGVVDIALHHINEGPLISRLAGWP